MEKAIFMEKAILMIYKWWVFDVYVKLSGGVIQWIGL